MEVILASGSRYRAAQLRRAGITFRKRDPKVDEGPIHRANYTPAQKAEHLAAQKAGAVLPWVSRAPVVIGADQVPALGDRLLTKPGDAAGAAEQLRLLQGRTHDLFTAVCVRHGDVQRRHVDHTRLTMRHLTDDQIARYVAADEPFDCAGSYKLEERGITLFERIASDDLTAVQGLPMLAVVRFLAEFGVVLP